jgi:peptide/nickel transport system substrate-binding protein
MVSEKGYWARRTGRRGLIQGMALAGAGAGAIALIGCSGKQEQTAVPATAQPLRGGTLRYIHNPGRDGVFPRGLDPHVVQASESGRQGLFYQSIIRQNPRTFNLEAQIAQRWEQPSATEYLFSLAPGIKFHNKPPANGRAMTVDDVVYSLNRARTNEPRFLNRSLLDSVETIDAANSTTVRIRTKEPDVSTLTNLSAFSLAIVAPEVIEKAGDKFLTPETAVGTGPFILQSMGEVGSMQVRNPDYWKSGLPYLDAVQLSQFREQAAGWAAFLAGQVDIHPVPGTESKKFTEEQQSNFAHEWFPDVGQQGLYVNIQKKPFDDRRVQRALRLLMDSEEVVKAHAEVWYGRGRIISAIPAALAEWDLSEDEYRQHLQWKQPKDEAAREAISLLSAAGFNRENPLTFELFPTSAPPQAAQGELLQAQYHRLGQGAVKVASLRALDSAALTTLMVRGEFDVTISGMVAALPEVDAYFRTFYRTGGSRNYGKYSDTTLDGMIDKQRTLFDDASRKSAVKDILRYLIDRAPYVSWSGRYILNATRTSVHDFAPEGESFGFGYQFEHVWLS